MAIAIVTGSNAGIGRATAVLLAERGYTTGQSLVVDDGISLMGPIANRG